MKTSDMKETMKKAGYSYLYAIRYTGRGKKGHVLWNHNVPGQKELWYPNKNHASYGLVYKNTHLEFCCTIKE